MSSVASASTPIGGDAPVTGTSHRSGSSVHPFAAGRIASIDTDDADELVRATAGWSIEYQVLDGTTFHSALSLVSTRSLQLVLMRQAMSYSSQGANPDDTASIVVPLDERVMTHRGHGIGPTQAGIMRSGEGYENVCRSGSRLIVASIADQLLERFPSDSWHESDPLGHASDRLEFDDAEHRSRYLDACFRIVRLAKARPAVLEDPAAAAVLEREFVEGLLLNAHLVPAAAHERHRFVLARRAYAYLQDHADQVPTIRELCAVAATSYATLERAFRETYGLTPKAMMTAMRLAGARRELLHPTPATSVTQAALRWGFIEFGRFAAQYRQRYGEAPSETLRRARGDGPPLFRSDSR